MSRGHLYWILSNPIYVGRLRHKGQSHDGLHPAIVDPETWDRVQQQLKSQTQTRRPPLPDDHSFLAGKLYDEPCPADPIEFNPLATLTQGSVIPDIRAHSETSSSWTFTSRAIGFGARSCWW